MENIEDNSRTLPMELPISVQYPTHDTNLAQILDGHTSYSTILSQRVGSVGIVQDGTSNPSSSVISRRRAWRFENWWRVLYVNMMSIAQWLESANSQNELELTSDYDPPRDAQGFIVPIREPESFSESTTTNDEEEPPQISEMESMMVDHPSSVSSMVTREGQHRSRVLGRISQNLLDGTEEDDTTNPPSTPTPARAEFIVPITESVPESIRTRDDEEEIAENRPPIEFESPNNQNQLESTSSAVDVLEQDPSIRRGDEQHTTRLHYYSDPKDVNFWLLPYPSFFVPAAIKFFGGKHKPLTTAFFKISIALYVMAIIIHIILSCIYERLNNPNSSFQKMSPYLYKILKYACYTLCILAYFSLLPVFLISNINPIPSPPPPPHPHLYHH